MRARGVNLTHAFIIFVPAGTTPAGWLQASRLSKSGSASGPMIFVSLTPGHAMLASLRRLHAPASTPAPAALSFLLAAPRVQGVNAARSCLPPPDEVLDCPL